MAPSSPAAFQRDEWIQTRWPFIKPACDAGFPDSPDHNQPDATGVGPTPLNNPDGIRWSTALGYLNLARHRLNLTIKANCMVHRLLFDGTAAVGVEVESGGERFSVYGDEIILCAGAIGSPQMLMLPASARRSTCARLASRSYMTCPGSARTCAITRSLSVTWSTKPDYPLDRSLLGCQMVMRWTAEGAHLERPDDVHDSFATQRVDRGGNRMTPLGIRMIAGARSRRGPANCDSSRRIPTCSRSWITATSRTHLTEADA